MLPVTRWGLLAVLLLAVLPGSVSAESSVRLGTFHAVARGFDNPTYVTAAPGEPRTLYVVEQPGLIRTVRNGRITGTFLDIRDRVLADGERGLLSMAFHPGTRRTTSSTSTTRISPATRTSSSSTHRDRLQGARAPLRRPAVPEPQGRAARVRPRRAPLRRDGRRRHAARRRRRVGRRSPEPRAGPEQPLGKLLRIDPLRAGAEWQIVGLGLRNPWRFSFDRRNGNLWIGDVGAGTSEEIDRRPAAQIGTLANYGWSHFEGRFVYNARIAMPAGKRVQPVYVVLARRLVLRRDRRLRLPRLAAVGPRAAATSSATCAPARRGRSSSASAACPPA